MSRKNLQTVGYPKMAESYKAVLNGHVEGLLIDAFVAGSMEEMLAGQDVYVKRVIDRSLSYGIVLSGQAVRLESACREYIAMHKEIIDQIKTNVKVLDLQTRQNSSVSVHRHQVEEEPVVSFEVVLFIVCSLLGGCVMLGLVWQIRYTTRRKPEVNPDIPQLSDIQELRGMVREFYEAFTEFDTRLRESRRKYHRCLVDKAKELARAREKSQFTDLIEMVQTRKTIATVPKKQFSETYA